MDETGQTAQGSQPDTNEQRAHRDLKASNVLEASPTLRRMIADRERAEKEAKQLRRLLFASIFEIFVIIVLAAGVFVIEYRAYNLDAIPQDVAIMRTVISPFFLVLCASAVLEIFLLILNGRAILVGAILALKATPVDAALGPAAKVADAVARLMLGGPLDLTFGGRSATPDDVAVAAASVENRDPVVVQLERNIERSAEAVQVAQRRPNALLFIGTVVAGVGLVFFLVTLPGFITTLETGTVEASDLWRRLLDLIPRLLMLVFIQLLAGFFLQKYRSAMEEFRYYEALLRQREEQLASYIIRKNAADNPALQAFAQDIMEQRNFMKITNGETTLVSDAHSSEINQFAGTLKEVFDFMKSHRALNGGKDANPPS